MTDLTKRNWGYFVGMTVLCGMLQLASAGIAEATHICGDCPPDHCGVGAGCGCHGCACICTDECTTGIWSVTCPNPCCGGPGPGPCDHPCGNACLCPGCPP